MTISAIAFDWGGIFTVNTFDSSVIKNLTARTGLPQEEVSEIYLNLMADFEAGAFDFDSFTQRILTALKSDLSASEFRELFLGSVSERGEMYQLLASIPQDYVVGMLSNNVAVLCDQVRDDPRMRRIAREQFVFSNEIKVRKPDPAAFAALSDALGKPAHETIFVDDNEDNIAACNALGYQGILLDTYENFCERWQALLPDVPLP